MLYNFIEIPQSAFTTKEMPFDEQPREKFQLRGAESLTDAELIAILLRTGSKRMNVLDTARFLLNQTGGLISLFRKSWKEISSIPGIGSVKSITLEAAFELGRRMARTDITLRNQFTNPESVGNYFVSKLRDIQHEEFHFLSVDTSNRIISEKRLSIGTLKSAVVDIPRLLKEAILDNANGIFLIHNHPSGTLKPSQHDLDLTKRIQKAADLFGIQVIDHLIVGGNKFLSFSNEGLL